MTEPTGSDPTPDQSPFTAPTDSPTSAESVPPPEAEPIVDVPSEVEAPPAEALEVAPVEAAPVEAAPVEAAPVEAAPVEAVPVEAGDPESAIETWPTTWDEIGLPPRLRAAVDGLGWTKPTPVQARCFPSMVAGKDVMVQSQTGSGKTGAFCLPWLANRFEPGPAKQTGVQLIVLLPTRELAKQVCEELVRLATDTPVAVLPVYGGTAMAPQLDALARGVHAVVGTPGRILDHIRRRSLDLSRVRTVVLDECDEMLSMGFLEDIRAILAACPVERQTCLYSATVPRDIERIARRNMRSPERIELSGDAIAAAEIAHAYYSTTSTIKTRDLLDMVMLEDPPAAIVFCNTREETRVVASVLQKNGYVAEALSSDLTQTAREKVMAQFRERKLRFLVATDVAARGIDVSHVSHVINFSFPENSEVYVHRTGRTGRAGRAGVALSIISPQEIGSFYTLTKSYKSIKFTERMFPPPEQLAPARIETKLDRISHEFAEPVSPEWILLARNLATDPRGERVIAYLLHAAIEDRKIPTRRELAGEEPEVEAEVEQMREYREREPRPERGRRGPRDREQGPRDRGPRDHGPRDHVAREPREPRDASSEPRTPDASRPRDEREGRRRRDRDRPGHAESRPRSEAGESRPFEPRRQRNREETDARPLAVEPVGEGIASDDELPYVRVSIDDDQAAPASEAESGGDDESGEIEIEAGEPGEPGEASDKRRRRRRRRRRKPEGDEVQASGDTTESAARDREATEGESERQADADDIEADDAEADESGEAEGDEGDEAESSEGEDPDKPRKRRRSRRRRRGKTASRPGGETPEGGRDESAVADGPSEPAEAVASEARTGSRRPTNDEGSSDEGRSSKRRRKRKRAPLAAPSKPPEPPPLPEPVVEPRVSQDEIIIDIDEQELDLVRDEFGEIDEFDELTVKGRRRAVLEELTEEMEVEDLSAQDSLPSAGESGEFSEGEEFEDDDNGDEVEAGEAGPVDLTGEATPSEALDDARGKKKRRRRRRKKAAAVEVPELSCPPHKDFWEVWAARYSAADFLRESDGDEAREVDEAPITSSGAGQVESYERDDGDSLPGDSRSSSNSSSSLGSLIDEPPDETTLIRVQLNLGRRLNYKASGVRALLKRVIGLHGKAVKDLTVRDQDTVFRMDAQHLDLALGRLEGQVVDGVALTLVRADEDARPSEPSEPIMSEPAAEPIASEPAVEPIVMAEPTTHEPIVTEPPTEAPEQS